jgi:hypothetical protein
MSSSGSDFSNEMASGIALSSSILLDDGVLAPNDANLHSIRALYY